MNLEDKRKAKQLHNYFMQQGRIFIVVNALQDAVKVPQHCLGNPSLRLILNTRSPYRTIIDEQGINTTLSFGGIIHTCFIPLNSIWAAYSPADNNIHKDLFWENSMPNPIRSAVEIMLDEYDIENIEDEDEDVVDTVEKKEAIAENNNNRRAHLRVIK